ncbi:hypothetical protein ASC97_05610 [Rhizobium sp. Root1203]|uniref:hypothetical protein n=1 Tax=Rhizobium sp. Root1203 TaxID=1736427 RepID=UPI00070E7A5C|nr:hypothetical protein [Rhizobium sp. Root1203]KQV27843.1 hypothetical protein ASC97_05610 [Rhizobium sp. Root1203]
MQNFDVIGYQANGSIKAVINGTTWFVPDDPSNADRALIAAWEFDESGNRVNTIPPYAAPPANLYLPLDPVDFKLGMLSLNVTPDMVDSAIDELNEPDRTIAGIYWTSAKNFYRDDVWLALIASKFNKTDQQIDEAWIYASSLSASVD